MCGEQFTRCNDIKQASIHVLYGLESVLFGSSEIFVFMLSDRGQMDNLICVHKSKKFESGDKLEYTFTF